MKGLRLLPCIAAILMLLVNCGEEKSTAPTDGAMGPKGVRVYVAAGSTTTAEVYSGPVPDEADLSAILDSPTAYGFVKIGTIDTPGDSVYEFEGDYEYLLLRVYVGAIPQPAPFVRIDAIQRMENNMYLTGRTYSGYAFWSSGDCDEDKLPACPEEMYWRGAPDGKCVVLFGWAFFPVNQWAP